MAFLSVNVGLFALLSFKNSAPVSSLKHSAYLQSTLPEYHNNTDIRTNDSNLSYPNSNNSGFRSLYGTKGVPTSLLCRIVNNKDMFCGWNRFVRRHWADCQRVAKSCIDKRLARIYRASHCEQRRKACPKSYTRIKGAVLREHRVLDGQVWMVKYVVRNCHLDMSPCGTLVSWCMGNGTWSPIKPKSCQSRFHSRELKQENDSLFIPIPWGFGPGSKLYIIGVPTRTFQPLTVNLVNGTDILLHVAVVIGKQDDRSMIVLDRHIEGSWQGEEKIFDYFPFGVGKYFNISIVATKHSFLIQEQGHELSSLDYGQLNGSYTKQVEISGSVNLILLRIIPTYDLPDT